MIAQPIAIDLLRPHPHNYNRHKPEQVTNLRVSLRRFGQVRSIVVQDDGNGRYLIVAGHGVVEAARAERLPELTANVIPADWPEAKVEAYLAADNELARQGDPDEDQLAALVARVQAEDPELAMLAAGSDARLKELLASLMAPAAGDDPGDLSDRKDELQAKWGTAAGQIWTLGQHRLVCGDCGDPLVVAEVLQGRTPTMVVSDPPYGVEYDPAWRREAGVNKNEARLGKVENDDRVDWSAQLAAYGAPVMYVWHAGKFAGEVIEGLNRQGYEQVSHIVWVKDRFALSRGDYHWQHEPCWYVVKKGHGHNWQGARDQSTVWAIPRVDHGEEGFGHGTQKPVECMERPIRNNSQRGDLIVDPFVGSGTTLIAAERAGRICAAVDIDPGYAAATLERWHLLTGRTPIMENEDGQGTTTTTDV